MGEIDDKAFLPLTRLIHLDLSANSLIILPTYLPPSLQELNLDFNPRLFVKSNEPKLPEMESLQKLFLSQNYIETFPKFVHNIPSLEELDLTDNSIRTLMLEDLAPMCNLRILNVSTESLFVSESMLCDCLRVQSWITSKKINVPSKFTCNNRNNEGKMYVYLFLIVIYIKINLFLYKVPTYTQSVSLTNPFNSCIY